MGWLEEKVYSFLFSFSFSKTVDYSSQSVLKLTRMMLLFLARELMRDSRSWGCLGESSMLRILRVSW